jgi:hypothetical protein
MHYASVGDDDFGTSEFHHREIVLRWAGDRLELGDRDLLRQHL